MSNVAPAGRNAGQHGGVLRAHVLAADTLRRRANMGHLTAPGFSPTLGQHAGWDGPNRAHDGQMSSPPNRTSDRGSKRLLGSDLFQLQNVPDV